MLTSPSISARTIKGLVRLRAQGDRAEDWARATLRSAGLPSEVGFYSPTADGTLALARDDLAPEEQDAIVAAGGSGIISWQRGCKLAAGTPWVAPLPKALERLGYAPGTPERDAAELLELLANVSFYVGKNDAKQAASSAFYAGMLWRARRENDDAEVGRRVKAGSRKGGNSTPDHEAHVRWFLADNELKRAGIDGQRERARVIADKFGVPFDTVRGAIRTFRKRQSG